MLQLSSELLRLNTLTVKKSHEKHSMAAVQKQ